MTMHGHMLIFGPGYTGARIAARLLDAGWRVSLVGSHGRDDIVGIDDAAQVGALLGEASHMLSTVPPGDAGDPVLSAYGGAIRGGGARWVGYLSSTGVYGDTGGAWVDESASTGGGRRGARTQADADWQAIGARVFRLPGIYGPGRSAIDRVRQGRAHRIAMPGQVFSRVHVDDIVGGVLAAFDGPAGVYNLADDAPCGQNAVIEAACRLLGVAPPPMLALEEAGLSAAALAFYAENRRVANGKAKRVLGWRLRYPGFEQGLASCL